MTNRLGFYRCEICGNIVQVLHSGQGELVCCGEAMELLSAHTLNEEKQEKHVPVFSDDKVKVGSEAHPMIPEHYIMFIQAVSEDNKEIKTKFLSPNELPEMSIGTDNYSKAYEYCNIHGLWKS